MPVIPIIQQTISTDVPGVDLRPRQSGVVGEAMARAGQNAADASLGLLGEMKRAEAREAVSTESNDDLLDAEMTIQKLKAENPDGYMKGDRPGEYRTNADGTRRTISDEAKDYFNDRFEQNQLKMPSGLAQEAYRERAQRFFTDKIIQVRGDEDQLKAQSYEIKRVEALQKSANSLEAFPSVTNAYALSNNLMEREANEAKAGAVHPNVTQMNVIKGNQQLAESHMRGRYNQILKAGRGANRMAAVESALAELDGKDPESQARKNEHGLPIIADMLAPDRHGELKSAFLRLREQAAALDVSDFNVQWQEANAAARMGGGAGVPVEALFAKADQFAQAGQLKPDEVAAKRGQLMANMQIGNLNRTGFALLSPAEQDQALSEAEARIVGAARATPGIDADQTSAGSVAQEAFRREAAQYKNTVQSAQQKDYAAFVAMADPVAEVHAKQLDFSKPETLNPQDVQAFIQRVDFHYDRQRPGDMRTKRIITKEGTQALGEVLRSNDLSTEQTEAQVKALVRAYGERYPEMINQAIEDKALPENARWLASNPSGAGMRAAIGAFKGGKDLEKNFKVALEERGDAENLFKSAVAVEMGPLIQATTQGNPNDARTQERISGQLAGVEHNARVIYMNSSKMTPEEAVKLSVQQLVHDNTHVAQVRGGGEPSVLKIPKRVGSLQINELERDQIVAYAGHYRSPEKLKALGVLAPPQADGSPSPFADKFYEQASKTGRYTTSPDERGLNFWYRDGSGRFVQAFKKDEKGRTVPLFVPFDEALKTVTEETLGDPHWVGKQKPVWGRTWQGIDKGFR